MGRSDVEVVLEAFERFGGDGLESALELISEDFVAEVPAEMSAEPDVYEGHDGARRYFAAFEGVLDDVRYVPIEVEDAGEAVIVWLKLSGRGVVSGMEVEQHAAVICWLADGKIVRMRPHVDMESAREELR